MEWSDLDLWEGCKAGNQDMLSEIYRRYFDDMYSYGYRILNDQEVVKDCVQTIFVKLISGKHRYTVTNLKAYLFAALRNALYQHQRQLAVRKKMENEIRYTAGPPFTLDFSLPEQRQQENLAALQQALQHLTARQKEVIYLRYIADVSYEDISDIMQLSTKGTYKLVARALQHLKELLSTDEKTLLLMMAMLKILLGLR